MDTRTKVRRSWKTFLLLVAGGVILAGLVLFLVVENGVLALLKPLVAGVCAKLALRRTGL